MSVVMKTRTEYTVAALEELHRVTSRAVTARETLRKKAFYLTWGSCALGLGAYRAMGGDLLLGAMALAGGAFLMVRYLFFFQIMARGTARNLSKDRRSSDYTFETYHIVARQNKDVGRYGYDNCHALLEAPGSIYFITQDGQCLMLNKQALEGGSVAQLREFLENKTGKTVVPVKIK